MGAEMYLLLEVNKGDDFWVRRSTYLTGTTGARHEWYKEHGEPHHRDYRVFHFLGGVRSRGMEFPSAPFAGRGWPEGEETFRPRDLGDHSPTYATIEELRAAEWAWGEMAYGPHGTQFYKWLYCVPMQDLVDYYGADNIRVTIVFNG